jgi:hypothetical protein
MRVHAVHGILDPVGASGLLEIVLYLQQAGFDAWGNPRADAHRRTPHEQAVRLIDPGT